MTVAPTPVRRHGSPMLAWTLVVALAAAALAVALLVRYDVIGGGSSTSAGIEGSGVLATQWRSLPAFGALDLAGSNVVNVSIGPVQSVAVHADANLLHHVTTAVRSGTLVVGTTGTFTTRAPMSVDITVPSLSTLTLSGSGTIRVTDVDVESLTVRLTGSGIVRVSGTATNLDVSLGGSGDAELGELVAREVIASVAGSGRILVNATNTLDASVPGSGAIMYRGNPAVTTNITGSGAVLRG